MNIKTAIANDVKLAASAKLAGDFYDDMLLRSNKFYENTAPLQTKITPTNKAPLQTKITPTNKAPGAKANLGRAGVAALLAGAGGIYLTKKLRDINSLIKSPGE